MNVVLLSVRGAETIRKGFIFFLPLEGMFLSHPVRVIKLSSCVETQLEECRTESVVGYLFGRK